MVGSVGNINNLYGAKVIIYKGLAFVSGDIIMKGYYKSEENPFFILNGEKWFNTGDYGKIDKDGNLYILGRESRSPYWTW